MKRKLRLAKQFLVHRAWAAGAMTLILVSISINCYCQIDLIEDSKGETSFELFYNKVNLNFAAEEISGKAYKVLFSNKPDSSFNVVLGGGLALGATKGKTVLFKKGELNSKGSGELTLGSWISNTKTSADWYPYFTVKITGKDLNLWDSTNVSIESKSVTNTEFQLGFTRTGLRYPIYSLAFKWGRTDNSSELKSGTFTSYNSTPSGLLQLDSKTAIGPASDFDDKAHNFTILGDLLWITGRVGIPIAFRFNFPDSKKMENYLSIGSGIFINKSTREPNQFIGGILIQDQDFLKSNNKDDFLKRLVVTLMLGIPLGDAF